MVAAAVAAIRPLVASGTELKAAAHRRRPRSGRADKDIVVCCSLLVLLVWIGLNLKTLTCVLFLERSKKRRCCFQKRSLTDLTMSAVWRWRITYANCMHSEHFACKQRRRAVLFYAKTACINLHLHERLTSCCLRLSLFPVFWSSEQLNFVKEVHKRIAFVSANLYMAFKLK